jgi:hypothetical protein
MQAFFDKLAAFGAKRLGRLPCQKRAHKPAPPTPRTPFNASSASPPVLKRWSPRAFALGASAIVVSVEYRHAPEQKFLSAHDDACISYKWVVENIHGLNGNADKIAANFALMGTEMTTTQPLTSFLFTDGRQR